MNLRAPVYVSPLLLPLAAAACGGSQPPQPAPPVPIASAFASSPPAVAPAPPPSASGIWLGTLHVGGSKGLRVQLRLDLAQTPPGCLLDSLDQHAKGIPCTPSVTGSTLSLDVPAVHGSFQGTLSADGNTVDGTWTQGGPIPLVLARQATAIEPTPVALDPAMPPVEVAKLKDVLDKDLAAALASGDLAPATDGGVTIGVVQHGVRRVFSYGTAKPDSVFEIGSVTKTFTGLLLAQSVAQKKARLDEPVRALLPAGTVAAPASGPEITLLDLSAQRSGLPRGATGGYSAFALFNPDADFAVVVLSNTSVGDRSFADDLGAHVAQRLTGKPAIPLGPASQ